jgi:hypothetical protein
MSSGPNRVSRSLQGLSMIGHELLEAHIADAQVVLVVVVAVAEDFGGQ